MVRSFFSLFQIFVRVCVCCSMVSSRLVPCLVLLYLFHPFTYYRMRCLSPQARLQPIRDHAKTSKKKKQEDNKPTHDPDHAKKIQRILCAKKVFFSWAICVIELEKKTCRLLFMILWFLFNWQTQSLVSFFLSSSPFFCNSIEKQWINWRTRPEIRRAWISLAFDYSRFSLFCFFTLDRRRYFELWQR